MYPGSKIAHNVKKARDKNAWHDRAARNLSIWGSESVNQKYTLFRQKGLRDDP